MDKNLSEDLIMQAASSVHADWCIQELKAFYERAKVAYQEIGNPGEALRKACFKGDQKRNEVIIDGPYLNFHVTLASKIFDSFEDFMKAFDVGAIDVKRFVKRNLTSEEKRHQTYGEYNYKEETGEENILRPFARLSADSKKENLEAAQGAYNVYVQMSKAGISIEDMLNNPEIRDTIGVAIHTDWLKRNMDHPNESLKVPYSQLDEWTKNQDLVVFDALLGVVKKNLEQYKVMSEEGFVLPDYVEEEKNLLGSFGR